MTSAWSSVGAYEGPLLLLLEPHRTGPPPRCRPCAGLLTSIQTLFELELLDDQRYSDKGAWLYADKIAAVGGHLGGRGECTGRAGPHRLLLGAPVQGLRCARKEKKRLR